MQSSADDPLESGLTTSSGNPASRARQIRDRAGTVAWLKGYLVALDDVTMHLDQLHTNADLRAWLRMTVEDTNAALRMVIQEVSSDD